MLSRWILVLEMVVLLLILGTFAISTTADTAIQKSGEVLAKGENPPSGVIPSKAGPSPVTVEPDYWPTHGWRSSTPEEQGMDSQQLVRMFEYIQARKINLHSLLIVRNGYLVTEAYFDPYRPETPHEIASLTKSVIGTLVGIAIDQGYIQGIDQPVLDFFPERDIANWDPAKASITVENLLTMTPGLNCSDADGIEQEMKQSTDWVQFMLDLPLNNQPGSHWSYCSGAAHLLSAILQNATGMDTRSYANANLFEPLGVASVPAESWESDPMGISTGSAGLRLAPRELAKYAYLYLNRGRWEQAQIVPADWATSSTQPHVFIGNDKNFGAMDRSYGYLWSIFPEARLYSALGMGGQHIHVLPELNLVVIFNAATPVNAFLFDLLEDYIIPSVLSIDAIPAKPQANAMLQTQIQTVSSPKQTRSALPEIAIGISNKTFRLEDNPMGWRTLALFFEPGSVDARIQFNADPALMIGLDNTYRVSDPPGFPGLALKGLWETDKTFSIQAIMVGTFYEYEIKLTFQGEHMSLFMHDTVLGGQAMRTGGLLEK